MSNTLKWHQLQPFYWKKKLGFLGEKLKKMPKWQGFLGQIKKIRIFRNFRATNIPAIRLGDVTETNRTQSPKQKTAGNWRSRTGTGQCLLQVWSQPNFFRSWIEGCFAKRIWWSTEQTRLLRKYNSLPWVNKGLDSNSCTYFVVAAPIKGSINGSTITWKRKAGPVHFYKYWILWQILRRSNCFGVIHTFPLKSQA